MVIFADGADLNSIIELNKNPLVQGFTTNPTLMRKSGVTDYKEFALQVLKEVSKPVSFEVIADDFPTMYTQALEVASWGLNVFVKIPITTTEGTSTVALIDELTKEGVKINVTAITTTEQVKHILPVMNAGSYVSVFAGRIADTGVDPLYIMYDVIELAHRKTIEVIWASPREVFNIYQAQRIGCDIITCTSDLIRKYEALKGKDLTEYSLETVQMFFRDATESELKL